MSSKKNFNPISSLIRNILILLIKILRPFVGPRGTCKFIITCSQYSEIQLQSEPFFKALYNIIKRILKCSFFYSLYKKIS